MPVGRENLSQILVRFVKLIYCFLLKYDKKASELIKWYIYQKYILYF